MNKKHSQNNVDLFQATLLLKNIDECRRFFNDLCTPSELEAMSDRLNVAYLLKKTDLSYRDIHEKIGTSIATITRVSRYLKHEPFAGYDLIIDRYVQWLSSNHKTIKQTA